MRKSTHKKSPPEETPVPRQPSTKNVQADYTGKVIAEIDGGGALGYGSGGISITFTDGSRLVASIERENYGHGDYGHCLGYKETPQTA